jgi:hypothetical protein
MVSEKKKSGRKELIDEERLKSYHELADKLSQEISGSIFIGSHQYDLRVADAFCEILRKKLRMIAKSFQF